MEAGPAVSPCQSFVTNLTVCWRKYFIDSQPTLPKCREIPWLRNINSYLSTRKIIGTLRSLFGIILSKCSWNLWRTDRFLKVMVVCEWKYSNWSTDNYLETRSKNTFSNACQTFSIWLSSISKRRCGFLAIDVSRSSRNHPGLLSKSHFLSVTIHFGWIFSARSQTDIPHYGTGPNFSFLFPEWRQETE